MSASRYIHVDFDSIKRETDNALLVVIDEEEIWLPKSQIADAEDYSEGDENGTISITRWIAGEKGLEER